MTLLTWNSSSNSDLLLRSRGLYCLNLGSGSQYQDLALDLCKLQCAISVTLSLPPLHLQYVNVHSTWEYYITAAAEWV
jgi:hypothetical protein